jgi:hypothetical protein
MNHSLFLITNLNTTLYEIEINIWQSFSPDLTQATNPIGKLFFYRFV